jgi:hypothetical protein
LKFEISLRRAASIPRVAKDGWMMHGRAFAGAVEIPL